MPEQESCCIREIVGPSVFGKGDGLINSVLRGQDDSKSALLDKMVERRISKVAQFYIFRTLQTFLMS